MLVVFVQRLEDRDEPVATLPTDLAKKDDALVATTPKGPFSPLRDAVSADPALRDRLARALSPRSVALYRVARPWLLLGLVPIAALVELERQLAAAGISGIAGRLVSDVLLGAFCALEIARPLPRHPRAAAVALASIFARYAYMIAASGGHVLPLFWLGAIGSVAGTLAMLAFMPTPARVAAELRARLELGPGPTPSPTPTPSLSPTLILALLAAIALPIVLVIARHAGVHSTGTALVFVAVGGAFPFAFRGRFRLPPAARKGALRVADAAFAGLALSLSLARLLHYAIAPFAPTHETSTESSANRWLLALMVVFVVPLVEERLYRHVLQRAVRARAGAASSIGLSSLVFGLAHLGVYRAAAYQTVLLGVGFGAAYEEGGLAAALLAHLVYNAMQVV